MKLLRELIDMGVEIFASQEVNPYYRKISIN
jgi:hypothetical protein